MADTTHELIDDLAALQKPKKSVGKTLPAASAASSIPGKSGIARPAADGTGSIASPLTETAYADRVFWPEKTLTSSDGLFTLKWKPIKQTKFNDANSAEVILNYQNSP